MSVYRRADGIEQAPLSDEVMLFDPEAGRFFVLNRTMAFIWDRCDGERTLEQILNELTASFAEVDPSRAQSEIDDAVAELKRLGLLVAE